MTLYPLDFEEYLMARGEQGLIDLIRECYEKDTPLDSAFHERALDYYKEYLFVGGMPEAVEEYGKNHNPELVRIIQQTILESYQNDMGKYNKQSEIPKTRIVYKNISTEIGEMFNYRWQSDFLQFPLSSFSNCSVSLLLL